jgi:phenylalanyl-tRNA synthetase beta chain
MRVSLAWLAEFVDLPGDQELADRLNLGGFEDAEIEVTGPDLTGVVVGRVAAREQHPNADRLSLCRVELGGAEPVDVVCGAPNVAADQKIAFAPVGTRLPDGTKLKKSKIRGVVSGGMICSARELCLGDDHEGILVLDPSAPVGAPLAQVVRAGEHVLEFGITPNRGDSASLLGVAREVSALIGGEVRIPETAPEEVAPPASDAIAVSIDAPDECHHYAARVVRGVRVGPSPDWLTRRLETSGLRSINNVVDVTNLVLLELGQPLHAFDLAEIRGARIGVRRAAAGEKLACLDGETRELDPKDLVICDAERPVALAGVMGGRLTARRHGLQTEASYRFERGVDRAGVVRAADRAARLIAELAGGAVAAGTVEARGTAPAVSEEIRFEVARANRLLGTDVSAEEARRLLSRVGVACEEDAPGVFACRVPSHRNDLHRQEDLTEELARVYGYDRIPTTVPLAELHPVEAPASWVLAERTRDALTGSGLTEVVCLPFVPPGDCDSLRLAADDPRRTQRAIVNPIKEEEPRLRTTLVPSLLRLAHQNLRRQIDFVELFEVSRVFQPIHGPGAPEEPLCVAAVLTQPQEARLWRAKNAAPLFFRAKGVAERLLIQAGYVASLQCETRSPYLHPGASAAIEVEQQVVGAVGELHPEVAASFELDVPGAVIELDLSSLVGLPQRERRYSDVSRQPQARRDVAVLLDREQPAGAVLAAIEKAAGADLVSAELFDRYEGRGIPEGKVSLAFRMVFQRVDRALTEKEVGKAIDRVVRMLSHRFRGELR